MNALSVSIPFNLRDEKRARSWWEALIIQRTAGSRHILAFRLSGPAILAEQAELHPHPNTCIHIEMNPLTFDVMRHVNAGSDHLDACVILGEYHETVLELLEEEFYEDDLLWLDADYTGTYKKRDQTLSKQWKNIAAEINRLEIPELFITQTFCRRGCSKILRTSWWNRTLRNIFKTHEYSYKINTLEYGIGAHGCAPMATSLIHIKKNQH